MAMNLQKITYSPKPNLQQPVFRDKIVFLGGLALVLFELPRASADLPRD